MRGKVLCCVWGSSPSGCPAHQRHDDGPTSPHRPLAPLVPGLISQCVVGAPWAGPAGTPGGGAGKPIPFASQIWRLLSWWLLRDARIQRFGRGCLGWCCDGCCDNACPSYPACVWWLLYSAIRWLWCLRVWWCLLRRFTHEHCELNLAFRAAGENDTCGIRAHAGRPNRLSRPTP